MSEGRGSGLTIRLQWDPKRKKWMLTWQWADGRRRANQWMWVETDAALDEDAARRMARAVADELRALLF